MCEIVNKNKLVTGCYNYELIYLIILNNSIHKFESVILLWMANF